MREILIFAIHLLVTLAKFLRPGGVRAVAAESLLLKRRPPVMSLLHSAPLNGPDSYAYLKDVLALLPTAAAVRGPLLQTILFPDDHAPSPDGGCYSAVTNIGDGRSSEE